MRAGQAKLLAQKLNQKGVGFDLGVNGLAIDRQADGNCHACLHVGGARMASSADPDNDDCAGQATTRYCRLVETAIS
ncbi:hypothetical protein GCM10009080_27450 [Cupriavidus pauculus]